MSTFTIRFRGKVERFSEFDTDEARAGKQFLWVPSIKRKHCGLPPRMNASCLSGCDATECTVNRWVEENVGRYVLLDSPPACVTIKPELNGFFQSVTIIAEGVR